MSMFYYYYFFFLRGGHLKKHPVIAKVHFTNFSRHCGHPHKFDVARQRFFSQKISQFKALSEMFLEVEQYNCLDNHDAFCCEVVRSGGVVDVAKSLEKMRSEVKKAGLLNILTIFRSR